MPDASPLIVKCDLHTFFLEEVTQACSRVGVRMQEATEYYLVHLLVDFSRRDDVSEMYRNEPLVVLHRRAAAAPVSEQLVIFKQLADYALYVAGFFAEFIEKSLVNMDYYTAMGIAAYSNLAQVCAAAHKPQALSALYQALARDFVPIVAVLTQISHRARQRSNSDIDLLKIYDRYVRTQSDRAKRMLEGRGLLVDGIKLRP